MSRHILNRYEIHLYIYIGIDTEKENKDRLITKSVRIINNNNVPL